MAIEITRMNLEELTRHLKERSMRNIKEWIERLNMQGNGGNRKKKTKRAKREKTKSNLKGSKKIGRNKRQEGKEQQGRKR